MYVVDNLYNNYFLSLKSENLSYNNIIMSFVAIWKYKKPVTTILFYKRLRLKLGYNILKTWKLANNLISL